MRALLQRVTYARVTVDNACVGETGPGLLVLLGVGPADTADTACQMAEKVALLRIFEDEAGKTNRSVTDVLGSALVISQFTLMADAQKGRRPSFTGAAGRGLAEDLYNRFSAELAKFIPVQNGIFGADMKVALENSGPMTILLEL